MRKRIISALLVVMMLTGILPTTTIVASAASRIEVTNTKGIAGEDIVTEARKWAKTDAVYWSKSTPWKESIYWRTGYTYNGQTSFDCSGFIGRILNDCGLRGKNYTPSYGDCILKEKYGAGYIAISIEDLLKYGEDITDAVQKAKNGDYSGLCPGDIIGWVNGTPSDYKRHIIIYAGTKDGKPWMVEWTGSGFLDRAITTKYQSLFENGARFVSPVDPIVAETYPAYCAIKINKDINVNSQPCEPTTDASSKTLETAKKNAQYQAIGLYLNKWGNLWYKVRLLESSGTGYLYAGNTTYLAHSINDIKPDGVTAPTTHTQGKTWILTGTVKSTYNKLTGVSVYVHSGSNEQGAKVTGSSVSVSSNSYSLKDSTLDDKTEFGKLEAGIYTYIVSASYKYCYATSGKTYETKTDTIPIYQATFTVVKSSACSHSYTSKVTAPTSTSQGYTTYTCTKCGHSYKSDYTDALTEKYTITFNANGGSTANSTMTVAKGKAIGTLPVPSFSGMNFVGWYTEPYGGSKVTSSTVPSKDITVWAHYSNPTYPEKFNYDTNGGVLPDPVYIETIDGVNIDRPSEGLVVFNQSGTKPGTNTYGVEIAINSKGKITAIREYGDETQLTVPDDGFILSGHHKWDANAGVSIGGATFVQKIIAMDEAYVSLDYETGIVKVFDSYAGYLAETKRGQEYTTLGVLPVPVRDGYVFRGWCDDSGKLVDYYSGFSGINLTATWERKGALYPEATLQYNGHCYELYDHNVSWTEAKELCESMGGYLVSITDAAEQAQVASLISEGTRGLYKIGATDAGSEGTWKWVNGDAFSYMNWDKSAPEPSNKEGENYGNIIAIENLPNKQVGEWLDDYDATYGSFYDISNSGFVCEYNQEPGCAHNYQDVVTEATCTAQGYTTHTCSICGDAYKDTYKNATGHSYGAWVTTNAATCTANGTQKSTCSACGDVKTQTVAASGHNYTSKVVGATCVEYEKTVYTCSGCGDTYTEYSAGRLTEWSTTKPSGVDEALIESRTDYRYRTKEYTTGTSSTMNGWTLYDTTTRWGDYGAWSSWSGNAVTANDSTKVETRTAYAYYYYLCSKCGAHMHGYGNCYTWAGGCGAATTNSGWRQVWSGTSWNSAGLKDWHGTGKYYTYIDGQLVFQHTSGGTKTQYRYCTRAQETVYSFYRWSDWSDWSTGTIGESEDVDVETRTVYRYVEAELGEHNYSNNVTAPTCAAQGYTTYTCSVCGDSYKDDYVAALGHNYSYEVTEPTCTEGGYTTYTCDCGDSYTDDKISALGHNMGDWITTDDPTCTETGSKRKDCSRCDHFETEVIPATGPAYTPGDIDGDNVVTQDDAVYLLLHTLFGEMFYPLENAPADIDGNGAVNQEDAVYLLLHTLFGEMFYPLNTPALPVKIKE